MIASTMILDLAMGHTGCAPLEPSRTKDHGKNLNEKNTVSMAFINVLQGGTPQL